MFIGIAYALLAASAPNATEYQYRVELEHAIQTVTEDPWEQAQLRKIISAESNWKESVGRCRVLGDAGRAYGPLQIHPRSQREKIETCGDTTMAVRIAIDRIHESLRACSHLPDKWKLSVFCSGSCSNRGGRRASELRWVSR